MDGLFVLALSPEDFSPETLPLARINFTTAELSEREDLRRLGDRELIAQLLTILQTTAQQALPLVTTPVNVAEFSLLGQWREVFHKAINHADFLDWADRRQLDFTTLQVRDGVLHGQVYHQPSVRRFTLAEDSGWWRVANPIIFIAQLLDPAGFGMPYIGERVSHPARTLSLDRVLAFYGYPMPANRLQAQVIIDELRAADAFPAIDDAGQNRSLIHGERLNQQRDYQQLANTLEVLAPLDGLALFEIRLHLNSGSLLARSVKEAARHLQLTIKDNGTAGVQASGAEYYYDHLKQAVCVLPRRAKGETQVRELRPLSPGTRWQSLITLADKVGVDVYPDHSLSLAACLQAYGIERITTQAELAPLITRLRQWPMPAVPTLYAAARSLDERSIYSRFIGVLNDRHALRDALYRAANSGTLDGPMGLDAIITIDPETLPLTLLPGRLQLRALVDQPEFAAILRQHNIDPHGHVLLSVERGLGARDRNGDWQMLTPPVMANPRLATMARKLLPLATQMGGELRTNEAISLRQALRLYSIPLPTTLEAARLTAHRRAITVPHPMHEHSYWRALNPAQATQPAGWTLSEPDRRRVIALSQNYLPDPDETLFSYLSQPVLAGKSVVDIRAEADLLMIRLIASPRAQRLAGQLAQAVQWQGSEASVAGGHANRSALLWAALILSLDPSAGVPLSRINGLDWTAPYFWGESVAFVRLQVERSFRGFAPGAAALAAHLMLCGQAPHLLVRDIPDSLPFLCTQTWVLFQQYASYLEQRIPGSARQMSHDEILYLAYLPLRGSWSLFLDSALATPPILDWAITNGILPRQEQYTVAQVNIAITALNDLRARLQVAQDMFAKPVPSQRQIALEALQKVYPQVALLEDLVWTWSPQAPVPSSHLGKKYAFVDLYMAAELEANSRRWVSSDVRLHYPQMAERFTQLQPFGQVFAQAFGERLQQVKTAYVHYLQNTLPALSLPRREALEFGKVEFFALRNGMAPAATFGILVCAHFYQDQHVYECFPKHMLMRPRRDLDHNTLITAATSAHQTLPNLAFQWTAYATGAEPADTPPLTPGLRISKLDSVLPEVEDLPQADTDGHRIPRSLDSARSQALAAVIADHYLQDGTRLHALAAIAPTLEHLSRSDDPWSDFLLSMALAAK